MRSWMGPMLRLSSGSEYTTNELRWTAYINESALDLYISGAFMLQAYRRYGTRVGVAPAIPNPWSSSSCHMLLPVPVAPRLPRRLYPVSVPAVRLRQGFRWMRSPARAWFGITQGGARMP